MIIKRKAITLVELLIAIAIGAVLLVALLHLFASGMKGSAKGMAHQANMQTASILMSQIEYDLLRATKINSPDYNKKNNKAEWKFYYMASGKNTPVYVFYEKVSNGIARVVYEDENHRKILNKTIFAKENNVDISFIHIALNTGNKDFSRLRDGMWVELTVSSKNKKTVTEEPFTLKRLVMLRNNIF